MTCFPRYIIILATSLGWLFPARAGAPLFYLSGNRLEIITTGQRKCDLLVEDISNARSEIELEYFIFHDDAFGKRIRDALIQKAREGITIRMILDEIGNRTQMKPFYKKMEDAGIAVRFFSDLDRWSWDMLAEFIHRDHRKILVIDNRIGYTGGMNLMDIDTRKWRDTHLRIEGPAAGELKRIFLTTWNRLTGEKQERPPVLRKDAPIEIITGSPFYPTFEKRLEQILQSAQSYAYFQTPYLCLTDALYEALRAAVKRGVDVRILIPRFSDILMLTYSNQSFHRKLLETGIRLFEFQPYFDHSKTLVCDDHLSWIGSVNLDYWSLRYNYEINVSIESPAIADHQKSVFMDMLAAAQEVTLPEMDTRSVCEQLSDWLLRRFRKWL